MFFWFPGSFIVPVPFTFLLLEEEVIVFSVQLFLASYSWFLWLKGTESLQPILSKEGNVWGNNGIITQNSRGRRKASQRAQSRVRKARKNIGSVFL